MPRKPWATTNFSELSARLAGTRALLGRLYGCLAVLLLMLALGGMGQG